MRATDVGVREMVLVHVLFKMFSYTSKDYIAEKAFFIWRIMLGKRH
jgi:hypothetical protein